MSAILTRALTFRLGKALTEQLTEQSNLKETTIAYVLRKVLEKYIDVKEK